MRSSQSAAVPKCNFKTAIASTRRFDCLAFLVPRKPARQIAANAPMQQRTQQAFLNHAPLRRRSRMPLPACSVPLLFQDRLFSAFHLRIHGIILGYSAEGNVARFGPCSMIAMERHQSV
jgi:hypothetical protein